VNVFGLLTAVFPDLTGIKVRPALSRPLAVWLKYTSESHFVNFLPLSLTAAACASLAITYIELFLIAGVPDSSDCFAGVN
jgi:hypothetical protein